MTDEPPKKPVAVYMTGASNIRFNDVRFEGFDNPVEMHDVENISFQKVEVLRQQVVHLTGLRVPPELFAEFVKLLRESRDSEKAGSASGLKSWLIAHGVDAAKFFLDFGKLILGT